MSNSVFSKPKLEKEVREVNYAATSKSSAKKDDFNIYGAETYCNYKIIGNAGTVLFKWDPARRKSPQDSFRISLGDARDLVNRGFFLWELPSNFRIYKQKLDEYVARKEAEYRKKYYK